MFWSSLQDRNDLRVIGMHVESSSRYADSAITLLHNRQAIAAYLILLFYLFFGHTRKIQMRGHYIMLIPCSQESKSRNIFGENHPIQLLPDWLRPIHLEKECYRLVCVCTFIM